MVNIVSQPVIRSHATRHVRYTELLVAICLARDIRHATSFSRDSHACVGNGVPLFPRFTRPPSTAVVPRLAVRQTVERIHRVRVSRVSHLPRIADLADLVQLARFRFLPVYRRDCVMAPIVRRHFIVRYHDVTICRGIEFIEFIFRPLEFTPLYSFVSTYDNQPFSIRRIAPLPELVHLESKLVISSQCVAQLQQLLSSIDPRDIT